MASRTLRLLPAASIFLNLAMGIGHASAGTIDRPDAAAERFNLGLRGVYFVENQGQWSDASVCFGLKSRGLDVAFRESSFTMHLSREHSEHSERSERSEPDCVSPTSAANLSMLASDPSSDRVRSGSLRSLHEAQYEHLTLTISFPGSNAVTPRGAQEQTAKFNYFVGGEGRGTASNVPSFGAVIYKDLYDGIDLLVCGNDDGVMKYEFHCAPGADYSQIRIHYDGIDSLCVNADGDLEIATSFGTLRDGAPIVWQEDIGSTSRAGHTTSRAREEAGSTPSPGSAGEGRGGGDLASLIDTTSRAREEAELDVVHDAPLPDSRGSSAPTLPARFDVIDADTYRIALDGPVDPDRELIIDPDLKWMTHLGGSGLEEGRSIAMDSARNAPATGVAASTDFEGRNNASHGGYDAFVVKVSASDNLQWMTYLGGSLNDWAFGIASDSAGNALATGSTISTDFEGRDNSHHGGRYYDAFVVKLRRTDELQLSVAATCPSGGPIRVSWSGATGAGLAALIFALEQGAFVLPPHVPCAGTRLGLGYRQLQVVWTGNSGPNGSGSIGRFAGPNACGGSLQLLDLTTCATSNVAPVQ